MQTSPSSEDRDRILRWLGHGAELARELKGDRATHRDVIWCLLCESVEVVDKLPDQDKRWLSSGTRSGGWNMVGLTIADLREIERIRLLSAMKPYDGATKVSPQSADIDRALGVMDWLRWCNRARRPIPLIKGAVALARGSSAEAVERILFGNRKVSRGAIDDAKTRVFGFILTGLRMEYGILAAEELSFEVAEWNPTTSATV